MITEISCWNAGTALELLVIASVCPMSLISVEQDAAFAVGLASSEGEADDTC